MSYAVENTILVLVRNGFAKRLDNAYLADRHTMKRLQNLTVRAAGEYLAHNPTTRVEVVNA